MPRQLVVCLDGTNNRFDHRPTNILHILRSLTPDLDQVLSYYDQGVGTFGLKETLFEWQKIPSRVLGLAFGWGIDRTICGAYSFLSKNYREGDEIYLFGFSRGAYAVRALAALIHACGLIQPHQLNLFDYAWAMLTARQRTKDPKTNNKPDFDIQDSFKATFGRTVPIKFLGIFDTVKSVGWVYAPTVIPFTANNSSVQFVRHAMSIDERRCFFRPNEWGAYAPTAPTTPQPANASAPVIKQDVKQVWFAGFHSDLGGGYPPEDSSLAAVALCWMLGESIDHGLNVDPVRARAEMRPPEGVPPNLLGDMQNSMNFAWKCAEWFPTKQWSSTDGKRHLRVGAMPPFGKPRPRTIPANALLHVSVKDRLLTSIPGRLDYRPPNLPNPLPDTYTIVNDNPKSPCT